MKNILILETKYSKSFNVHANLFFSINDILIFSRSKNYLFFCKIQVNRRKIQNSYLPEHNHSSCDGQKAAKVYPKNLIITLG